MFIAYEQAHIGVQANWSSSVHGVATGAKSSSEAERQESEPALISARFLFPPQKPQKK